MHGASGFASSQIGCFVAYRSRLSTPNLNSPTRVIRKTLIARYESEGFGWDGRATDRLVFCFRVYLHTLFDALACELC